MISNQGAVSRDSRPSNDVYRQIDPVGFYGKFLRQGIRPDGRKLNAFRKVGVFDLLEGNHGSFQRQEQDEVIISSCRLTAGETHMHCVVTAVPTFYDLPIELTSEGDDVVSVEIDLPKQVQPYIYDANGHCANLNFCVSAMLANAFNSGNVLPTAQLRLAELLMNPVAGVASDLVSEYLVKRRFSWKLDVNVVCEEYDGNLVDTSVLATAFALRKAWLPIILVDLNESLGSYEIRFLDRELLDLACSNDRMVLKLLQNNRISISKQLGMELVEESMVQHLVNHFRTTVCVGRPLHVLALPYTVTFLKYDEQTFLVDPTKEEEKLGSSVSIYSLRRLDGSSSTQQLNLMSCSGITNDVLDSLERVATHIINYIANTEY
ncbi:hypothetical protein X943_003108 [Babesia divergens]|uniref:Ribosomal RNA-processing protein 43 n=1 Tax=Babesia divergens TaxID=32595 RepID=A0AAD9G7M5_BABDI|nr:hypothetical protein X943_003108 [Babesia divergens]